VRVRVARCAVLFWHRGKLVLDDWLTQRQLALSAESEQVLRWFADWRELETVEELDERLGRIAYRLLEAGVLVAEGSEAHRREEAVEGRWGGWLLPAGYFHFATRTHADARCLALADDIVQTRARSKVDPPPAPFRTSASAPLTKLREGLPDDTSWPNPRLVDALARRRSTRRFAERPVSHVLLAGLLDAATGVRELRADPALGTAVLTASPSAGGCQPIEVYVHARAVEGVEPGLYHFAPARGGLERLGEARESGELETALGEQPWLAAAPVLLLYTAVIGRSRWRYETPRAYRDLLIGLGHTSQTVLLTAAAMGLGAVFATAVRDERVEEILGCDPLEEIVLGVAALGWPEDDGA
jgi:SagB-type dehydrogenase family enzyme